MFVLQITAWVEFLPVPAVKLQLQPHLHKEVNLKLKYKTISGG